VKVAPLSPYLPPLVVAMLAFACVAVVRRGPLPTRVAVVLLLLLPVHLAIVVVLPDRYCNLIDGTCLALLDVPLEMLRSHIALAGVAVAAAVVAWIARPARRPARAP
jgi:hypothetical protein